MSIRKSIVVVLSIFALLLITPPPNSEELSKQQLQIQTELKEIFDANLQACQDEDLDKALEISVPENRHTLKPIFKSLFDMYDLSYRLDSFKLVSATEDSAVVEIVQITKKIKGPAFKDNKLTANFTFVRKEGKWYNTNVDLKEIEFLE